MRGRMPAESQVGDARRRVTAIERFFQSLAATVLNVLLRLVPTRVKAAIAATAINAAIRAYSMAVTPDSSRIRLERRLRKRILLG